MEKSVRSREVASWHTLLTPYSILHTAYSGLTTATGVNMSTQYRGFRDLKVYQLAYALSMEIFKETRSFPKEETYSLTDQIRRASRSIGAGIAEGWRKRRYAKSFVSKLVDSWAEEAEVEVWLDTAYDCGYLSEDRHAYYRGKYEEVSKMLYSMIEQPEKFCY